MSHDHGFSSPMDGALGNIPPPPSPQHPPFESMLETIARHIVFYDEEPIEVNMSASFVLSIRK